MELERLAAQNPWWTGKEAIEKDDKVDRVLKTGKKIVFNLEGENSVLIGPRQLGKTTALKYDIYKKIMEQGFDPTAVLYYSFDTSRDFNEISEVINAFVVDGRKRALYLDEVSFVDGWQRAVKKFLDSAESANATVYVTGSSSINLRKELMPGRKIKFLEFRPLSFRDFLISFGSGDLRSFLERNRAGSLEGNVKAAKAALPHFEEIKRLFGDYTVTGGYPDAIFDYIKNGRVGENVFDTHWNAFVSDISKDGKSVEIATAVVYGILGSYSSKINLSAIARMQGIKSHVTVREYLEAFEDLFVARSVFPVAGRRYVFRKDRKVYFSDPFLYNLFAKKLNLLDRERESKIVEGIAYNHIYRAANRGKGIAEPKTNVCFYSGKREVDFVVGGTGLEVKWKKEVGADDFPDVDLKNRVLLSQGTYEFDRKSNLAVIPLPVFLSTLV